MSKVRISAVSYTNTLPFLHGLKHADIMEEIDLTVDYPAECARKVIENEADLGIIPTAAILEIPDARIIGDYCIGTEGAVDSVFIFSEKPIEEIKSLQLDHQSKTSNGLARILLKHYWKRDVVIQQHEGADAYVLIGDRTFGKKDTVPFSYDLGYYWKQFTGLPFAFALWIANKDLPTEFIERFNAALANGVAQVDQVIEELPAIADFDYMHYLTKSLDFKLTAKKREAVKKYLDYYQAL